MWHSDLSESPIITVSARLDLGLLPRNGLNNVNIVKVIYIFKMLLANIALSVFRLICCPPCYAVFQPQFDTIKNILF